MIEECIQALARITRLKKDQQWEEAASTVDEACRRVLGAGTQTVRELSETELLARLIQGDSTLFVRDKLLFLTALLNDAGDVAAAQNRPDESRAFHLKGLHLLLETLGREDLSQWPEFVPRVEVFLTALRGAPLPLRTQTLLMRHYEETGDFAKAEDALFAMLDGASNNAGLVDFGLAFYERLQRQSDAALAAGNLPRAELDAGEAELRDRKARLSPRSG